MAEKNFAQLGFMNQEGQFQAYPMRARDVIDTKGVSAETHMTDDTIHLTTEQINTINGAVQATEKGAANGVATLGADGKLPAAQIDLAKYQTRANVDTYAEMLALTEADCPVNGYAFVTDATGDPSVKSGWAIYTRVAELGNAADYVKVSEGESIDVTLPDFEQMRTDTTAAANAASAAQSTADAAQTTADAAALEAAKLSFCVASSEAELEGKNLKQGAMVLMLVDNN